MSDEARTKLRAIRGIVRRSLCVGYMRVTPSASCDVYIDGMSGIEERDTDDSHVYFV